MATASVLASTKETTNYARLCRLQVDGASHVLREKFDNIHPPVNLAKVLGTPPVYPVLQNLRRRKVLNPQQWGKLFPLSKSTVSSNSFDITLLVVLLRSACGLTPPHTGWDNLPPPTDTSLEADIARIKYYRNHLYGHASEAKISDADFKRYWEELRDVLVRLGGKKWEKDIDELETEVMDPDIEEHYIELLKDWYKDDRSILDKLEQLEKEQRDRLEQIGREQRIGLDRVDSKLNSLLQKQDEILEKVGKSTSKEEDNELGTGLSEVGIQVRASLKQFYRDEFSTIQPLSWCEDRYDMDTTYTDLVIKERKDKDYREEVSINSVISNFVASEPGKPKPLLIEGDPGMGKTTLCHKLCYDWATKPDNVLKEFDAVFLVECCKCTNSLKNTISEQLFPEDFAVSRDDIWEFVRENQTKVLFIVDGYDELSSASSQLDIVKVIRGKILHDSCVMVSSRLDKSDSIRLDCKQAKCFRIFGLSKESIKTYVANHFSSDRRKGIALGVEIARNRNLMKDDCVTPLHILFHCVLWDDDEESPPSTVTELYHRMLVLMVSLYCTKYDIPVGGGEISECIQADLLQLGRVALQGVQRNTLLFDGSDVLDSLQDLRILKIGFLTKERLKSKVFCKSRYMFTHKSLQEFIAAYYLAFEIRTVNCILAKNEDVIDFRLLCIFLAGLLQEKAGPVFQLLRATSSFKVDRVTFFDIQGCELKPRICFPVDNGDYPCGLESMNAQGLVQSLVYSNEEKLFQMIDMLQECTEDYEGIIHACAAILPSILDLSSLNCTLFSSTILKLLRIPCNPVQTVAYHSSQMLHIVLPITAVLQALNGSTNLKVLHLDLETDYVLGDTSICESLTRFLKSSKSIKDLRLYVRTLDSDVYPSFPFSGSVIKKREIRAVLQCMKAIAGGLCINTSLHELYLRGCRLDTECLEVLLNGMRLNNSLAQLDLEEMVYINFNGWRKLHDFLTTTSTLKKLNLSYSFQSLCEGPRKMKVTRNSREQNGMLAIMWALKRNCSLTSLYLCGNKLEQLELKYFSKVLKTNTNLKYLSFGEFHDVERSASWFKEVFGVVRNNSSLEDLDISSVPDMSLDSLSSAESEPSHLYFLSNLRKDCLSELESFISENEKLKSLIMRSYRFPAVGNITEYLSCGVSNKCLQTLDLGCCSDKSNGNFLVRWAMSLVSGGPLERLILLECQLNDKHLQHIATWLRSSSTTDCSLTFLDLSLNSISSIGLNYLAAALRDSPSPNLRICLDSTYCHTDLQQAIGNLSEPLRSSFICSKLHSWVAAS